MDEQCANCGKHVADAKQMLVGKACYDGEWTCSAECDDEMNILGCPQESGGYRTKG